MTKCLVSLSEETVATLMALKLAPGESLDSVVGRVVAAATAVRPPVAASPSNGGHTVALFGNELKVRTVQDALASVLAALGDRDEGFLGRLAAHRGRTRRIVARTPEALYPGSPHLAKYARELSGGWWMATNCSRRDVARAVCVACKVADVAEGVEVAVKFDT